MADRHLQTLTLPPLQLELFQGQGTEPSGLPMRLEEGIQKVWPHFLQRVREFELMQALGISEQQTWEVDLGWLNNAEIRELNREYRDKDEPTDVLSFTLLADAVEPSVWAQLPVVQLGSLYISLELAQGHAEPEALEAYVLTRFVHGMLHLLGQHHDTMPAYERVVTIQRETLEAAGYAYPTT